MRKIVLLILFFILISCNIKAEGSSEYKAFKIWFENVTGFNENYEINPFIQPKYLIADFNGDGINDIVVLIKNKGNNKKGFIIFHPSTQEYFIIGAGVIFEEDDAWDDLNWVDEWRINKERNNEPGIQGGPDLILKFDSIEITKKEIGGGLIYWDEKKYKYFHQTC